MHTTQPIDTIKINDKELDFIVSDLHFGTMTTWDSSSLLNDFEQLIDDNKGWIKTSNKDVFYHGGINALIPNFENFICDEFPLNEPKPEFFNNKFDKYTGELISMEQIKKLFIYNINENDFYFFAEKYNFFKKPRLN